MGPQISFATPTARGAAVASVALIGMLVLAACGGDGPAAPAHEDVAGTWVLESIDGENLPTTVSETETCTAVVTDGSLSFRSAARVRMGFTVETTCTDLPEQPLETLAADFTYKYDEGSITLFEPGASTPSFSGTVAGATLSIEDATTVMVFHR